MTGSNAISAVLDEQMDEFLASIGELDRVRAGESNCVICGKVIEISNIGLVVPAGNKVNYVCDDALCIVRYTVSDF